MFILREIDYPREWSNVHPKRRSYFLVLFFKVQKELFGSQERSEEIEVGKVSGSQGRAERRKIHNCSKSFTTCACQMIG